MRSGRLAGMSAYCGRFIARQWAGLLLLRVGCVLIFLFAASFESWIIMLWPRWIAASCTLPLNVGVPLMYVWMKARSQRRSGLLRWYTVLIGLVPSVLVAAILISQWVWLIGIRIPLNRRVVELSQRAQLWQPTQTVFRGIDRTAAITTGPFLHRWLRSWPAGTCRPNGPATFPCSTMFMRRQQRQLRAWGHPGTHCQTACI